MARAKTNKLYRTFTKGLITEASPLTYPEDASIDELNTVISRKGNRTRRVGLDYQPGYVFEDLGVSASKVVNEFVWLSANNDPLKNFLVVQVGTMLNFYTIGEGAISTNLHATSINLLNYKIASATGVELLSEFASFSAGAGFLYVAHRFCDPITIEYDPVADTFLPVRIVILIRDFEGVNDGLPNDAEPTTLSKEHLYNLRNQGWVKAGSSYTAGAGTTSGSVLSGSIPSFGGNNSFGPGGGYVSVVYFDSFTGEWIGYDVNGDLHHVDGEEVN